jgi:hypothetical protein
MHDRTDAKSNIDAVLNRIHATFGGVDMNLDIRIAMLEWNGCQRR